MIMEEKTQEVWEKIYKCIDQIRELGLELPKGREGCAVVDMSDNFKRSAIQVQRFYLNEFLD